MKTNTLIYIISLIFIGVSIYMVLEGGSNRNTTIAGGLALVGFVLNIVSFSRK
ncbi:hypothetical protein [Ekhidna sp.]|uniref:hypothetical protein n=1 Tax=Ekhidna sp. TaxID=2608089 RepID=UPI003B5BD3BC